MKKNTRYWLAQFIGWGAYYLLMAFALYTIKPSFFNWSYVVESLVHYNLSVALTHLGRFIFIRFQWLNWSMGKLVLPVIGVSILTSVIMYSGIFTYDSLFSTTQLDENITYWSHLLIIGWYTILCLLWNVIYFTYHFSQKSIKQEVSNLKLKANNKEIQLKNLQSQLNPHFLFNSLNGIRALVDLEPQMAKKSITRLSSLLRISLQFGKQNLVSIEDEIQLVQHYLELEKMRFEHRLNFSFHLEKELLTKKIPPFTLQLLVENAIKHGISQRKKGGEVLILVYPEQEWTVIEVKNSGTMQEKVDLGVGLTNIRKRLLLQYGRKNASFTLNQIEGEEVVLAKVKIKE